MLLQYVPQMVPNVERNGKRMYCLPSLSSRYDNTPGIQSVCSIACLAGHKSLLFMQQKVTKDGLFAVSHERNVITQSMLLTQLGGFRCLVTTTTPERFRTLLRAMLDQAKERHESRRQKR